MSNYRYIEMAALGRHASPPAGQQTMTLHDHDYRHLRVRTQIRHIVPFAEPLSMALRTAFAAALRFLRARRDLSQGDLALHRDQSHVSRLEAGQRGVTLQVSDDLAKALGVDPMTLLAIAYAAEHQTSPREILSRLEADLSKLNLLDDCIPLDATAQAHPVAAVAGTLRSQIEELKAQGLTQAEIARRLGVSEATVSRHLRKAE